MQYNLKTTLLAYPKLSPSILADYVTKEELQAANYVDKDTLDNLLVQYVKEMTNANPAIIYGRQVINNISTWVPILETPTSGELLCYGMIDSNVMTEDNVTILNRATLEPTVYEYMIEYQPSANGYFWFCSTREIDSVINAGGLEHEVGITKQVGQIPLVVGGVTLQMNCYKTERLAAVPGVPYKFKIILKQV